MAESVNIAMSLNELSIITTHQTDTRIVSKNVI